jgi:S-adenosylmethionine:tRNA ribosyltransferase-isomerase
VKTKDFSFDVPPELIAQYPTERRDDSRLLVLDVPAEPSGGDSDHEADEDYRLHHAHVRELGRFLPPRSLLIFNNTRVIPARISASRRDTGGTVSFLLLEQTAPRTWRTIVQKAKRRRPGQEYDFPGGVTGRLISGDGEERVIEFSRELSEAYLEEHGQVPLPPYVRREPEAGDKERYQTVYAEHAGSAAAPTAGLHFTEDMLEELRSAGHELHFLTLHVGLGTFSPVRAEDVEEHEMHREHYSIPEETADAVSQAKREGRPVIAVGTTTTRALESAAGGDSEQRDDVEQRDNERGARGIRVRAGAASTALFIYPGYRFRVVDWQFTNFHTPGSSLVMMVSALTGRERLLGAYREAVRRRYRFFSYGDAMLIRRAASPA